VRGRVRECQRREAASGESPWMTWAGSAAVVGVAAALTAEVELVLIVAADVAAAWWAERFACWTSAPVAAARAGSNSECPSRHGQSNLRSCLSAPHTQKQAKPSDTKHIWQCVNFEGQPSAWL
jgi:hypothetical protein